MQAGRWKLGRAMPVGRSGQVRVPICRLARPAMADRAVTCAYVPSRALLCKQDGGVDPRGGTAVWTGGRTSASGGLAASRYPVCLPTALVQQG